MRDHLIAIGILFRLVGVLCWLVVLSVVNFRNEFSAIDTSDKTRKGVKEAREKTMGCLNDF